MGSQYSVGGRLRAERVRQKRSIESISRETRISLRMVEAIEKDDFGSLPGLLFTRNFVKQYALALRLDPEPLVAELPSINIETAPMPDAPARLSFGSNWDPSWNGAISSLAWLAIAIIASAAAYIHFNQPVQTQASSRTPVAAASAPNTAPNPSNPEPARRAAQQAPAPSPAGRASAPLEKIAVATSAAANHSFAGKPLEKPADTAADTTNRKVNVSITAHEDSWIEVSADGKTVFTGTLKPNESKEISADGLVKLVAGNAGGISVSLNGHALHSIGASGEVKVLRLTEGGPQAAVRSPAPSDRL